MQCFVSSSKFVSFGSGSVADRTVQRRIPGLNLERWNIDSLTETKDLETKTTIKTHKHEDIVSSCFFQAP